jgi:hypothetical protein
MSAESIEIFVHSSGAKPKVIGTELGANLRDVLAGAGAYSGEASEHYVFLGECDEALREPEEVDDGVDNQLPVEVVHSLRDLDVQRHHHVHVTKCRHVVIDVKFLEKDKRRKFSPAATIGTATEWARKKFRLDPAIAGEYVLQLSGTTAQPRTDEHLGELLDGKTCTLSFDLVKEVTPAG